MLRRRAWGMSAALFAALGGAVAAAEPGNTVALPQDRGNAAFQRWNAGQIERPKPPPPPVVDPTIKSRVNETAAAMRAQEEANLFRRIEACQKLRELALQTGDDSLEKLADELEQKATAAYMQRTANSLNSQVLTRPEPDSRPATASNSREGKR